MKSIRLRVTLLLALMSLLAVVLIKVLFSYMHASNYVPEPPSVDIDIHNDRYVGAIVGGAVGDALGYPVEFLSYDEIVEKYGEKGITRYECNDSSNIAEISDDTQMSLYTANGLIINDLEAAYLEWYMTQQKPAKLIPNPKCWISEYRDLYNRRAPGRTCLLALKRMFDKQSVYNNSNCCGGIMRVAPVAVYGAAHNWSINQTLAIACEAARVTHKHPFGWMPAGEYAAFLQLILQTPQDSIIECLQNPISISEMLDVCETALWEYIKGRDEEEKYASVYHEFNSAVRNILPLIDSGMKDIDAIEILGEGWTGEEAWYISLYCLLSHIESFDDAIIAAVNHDGDSDSTGALTGALMGAIYGYKNIPDYYKRGLELRIVIEKTAGQLCR